MEFIATGYAPQAIGPYSQAVKSGEYIFCSGQIPLRPDGAMVEGGISEQTAQVLDNLDSVLKAAGSARGKVIKTTVFLVDMNDFAAMNEVYAMFFGDHKPARATIQAARLPKDVRVEIECIATA